MSLVLHLPAVSSLELKRLENVPNRGLQSPWGNPCITMFPSKATLALHFITSNISNGTHWYRTDWWPIHNQRKLKRSNNKLQTSKKFFVFPRREWALKLHKKGTPRYRPKWHHQTLNQTIYNLRLDLGAEWSSVCVLMFYPEWVRDTEQLFNEQWEIILCNNLSAHLFVCQCLSVCLFLNLSVPQLVCLSISPPVRSPVCLSICLFLRLSVSLSVCASVSLYVCPYLCLCASTIHLSVCLSIYLFVRLCVSVFMFCVWTVCLCVCFPVCVSLPLTEPYDHLSEP